MKAILYKKYGPPDVIQIADIEKPIPNDNEVLIKIHAASLNAYDWHFLTADIFLIRFMGGGLFKPKDHRLGSDIAGRVEAVGKNIKQFKLGDEVIGMVKGGLAEYATAPESSLWFKPSNISFIEAAAIPMAGISALQGLRNEGNIQKGQKVLIHGASGGVGTFAVQIAKSFDTHVTAVCSKRNIEQSKAIGADHVIDYTKDDFTQQSQQYDLIIAVNGYHTLADYKKALTPKGIFVMIGGTKAQILQSMFLSSFFSEKNGRQMRGLNAQRSQKDLMYLKDIFEAGKIKSVIEKTYPFNETPDAFRYFGEGHSKGKIIITL